MDAKPDREPVIEFRNVSYCLRDGDGRQKSLLESLDLSVSRGER